MKTPALSLLLMSACVLEPDASSETGVPSETGSTDTGAPETDGRPVSGVRETPDGLRHLYSQLQAWTSDARYVLTVDVGTGEGVVLQDATLTEVARLGRVGHRWIPGTQRVLMFDDQPATGAALYVYDVDTGEELEWMTLGHPGLRAGRSHEETDASGRWVAVYIDEATAGGPRIVTADLEARRVAADVAIADLGCDFEPDWVGVDPTGAYLLVQSVRSGPGTCSGLWTHDIETGAALRQITEHHNHGSTGLSAEGRPYFLSLELAHPQDNNFPGIYRYWLDTGEQEVVGEPLPWGALEHVSCLGGPGSDCVASASPDGGEAYRGTVWLLAPDGERTILREHDAAGCGYWGQAQATAGPAGSLAFATHGGDCDRIRSVVVAP